MDDSKKKCSEEAPRRALKPVPQITLSEAPDIDQNSDECIVVPPSPPSDIAEEKTPEGSEDKGDKGIPDDRDKENTAPDKPKPESTPKVTGTDNNKNKTDTTPHVTDKSAKDAKDSAAVKSSDKPKDKTEKPDKVDSTADKPDNNVKAKPDSSPKPPGKDSSADKLPDKTDSKANDKAVKPDSTTTNTPTTTTTTTTKPADTTDKPDKPADKKTDTTTTTTIPTQADTTPKTTTTTTTNTTKPTEKNAEPTEATPKPATNASQPDKKESNATKTDTKEDQGKEKGSEPTKPVPKPTDEGKGAADGKAQDGGGGGGHTQEESVPFNGEEETIPLRTKEEEKEEEKKNIVPARLIFAVLGCVGFMIVYGLKVNLSVAIIAMVNHTAVAHGSSHDSHDADDTYDNMTLVVGDGHGNDSAVVDDCGRKKTKESLEDGPFAWDENVQGLILASYFYGYLITQVPGGWVAEKFSAKHVFGVGALVNAVCAILSPIAAKGSYIWLVVIRIIMGIAGGVTLPGMHVLIAKWAPPQERSKIASGVYAGMTLGTLVCMPFSGFLAASLDWSAVFYVQGGLSLLWYILWLIFVYDSPAQHPRISRAEKKYIEESLGTVVKTEKPAVPWKSVWTSMPVWAIIVAHTCSNWGWYMLLVKLPTYMRYILKFDIKSNAALSAVPFLCMWIFTMLLANVLDALRARGFITTTFARKLATFFASVPPSVCLIGVTYVGCNTDLAVALLTLGTMFVGGMYSGFLSNHIDIAPPFAGTLMGITNTFATLPGIIVPSFVGFMTHGNQTVEAWRTIFFITLGIFLFEAIFYTIFGSGEQQEWAKPKPQPQEGEQQKLNDIP